MLQAEYKDRDERLIELGSGLKGNGETVWIVSRSPWERGDILERFDTKDKAESWIVWAMNGRLVGSKGW